MRLLGPLTVVVSLALTATLTPASSGLAAAGQWSPLQEASGHTLGSLAVAVECREKSQFEDPPMTVAELVWTAEDGWTWRVQSEGVLASVDWAPQGQYVAFATSSQYGRPHHVTIHHPDLGWRDLTRRPPRSYGDDLVAAIDDSGDVVVVRGVGFED